MYGNDSLPTKVYSYGAKRGPVENRDECFRQLRAAHRYRNKLVEIEKNRRSERDAAMLEMFPQLAAKEAAAVDLARAIGEIERAIKDRRAGQHLRLPATKEEKANIKRLKAEKKAAWEAVRVMKAELRTSEAAQERLKAVNENAGRLAKEARAACNVAWGTYLQMENAVQQAKKLPADPQFRPFRGEGKLAIQIQGGMTVDELYGCQDSRVRMERVPDPTKRRGKAIETTIWIRIGSLGKNGQPKAGGHTPIWATFRVRIDRPLPEDCRIKWVFAVARRVATKTIWSIQFQLSREEEFTRAGRAESGAVAVDVGWRMLDDGLRVGYWVGTDGEHQGCHRPSPTHGKIEYIIPAEHMRQWAQVEDLQSIRDTHFNEVREMLAGWRDGQKKRLPEWFREWTKHLRKWRSPAQLASLVLHWRGERIVGDDVIFAAVEAWRQKDKHLYEWEANLRRKAQAWRKDFYRCLATELASRYKTVVLEDINQKTAFQDLPAVEKDEKAAKLARRNRGIAAIGELRGCLAAAFDGEGGVVKVNPAYTSKRCHKCKMIGKYDDPSALSQICPNCLAVWDRDENAARNILDAGERLGDGGSQEKKRKKNKGREAA